MARKPHLKNMSGSVRLVAIAFGAALVALLYFVWGSRWYWALLAGALAFTATPMLHERIAGAFRRRDLKKAVKKGRDLDRRNRP